MSQPKEQELANALASAADLLPSDTDISITPGLPAWMLQNRLSLAFTSYQTGQLILAGVGPDGRISFDEQNYARATGLCYENGRLHVGSMFQIWRLENMLRPGQYAKNAFDRVFVPRQAQTVNYLDVHEIGIDASGRTLFVNSRYSCLATFHATHSFQPVWKPPFISELAPEDRCHLNGMALENGIPRYVTALAATDTKEGWRENRATSGIVVDVGSGEIVSRGLSMPHSPRLHDGALWALDSGRGWIVRIDPSDGRVEDVAFCPGFLRGLEFNNGYALVTVSKAREGEFTGLPLQQELERRGLEARCGVLVVDMNTGQVAESILFEGKITEMFAVTALPDIRNPMSVGPATVEMIGNVSVADG